MGTHLYVLVEECSKPGLKFLENYERLEIYFLRPVSRKKKIFIYIYNV